jgi:hypothetical protein
VLLTPLPPVSLTLVANLPPVPTTPVVPVENFAIGVVIDFFYPIFFLLIKKATAIFVTN